MSAESMRFRERRLGAFVQALAADVEALTRCSGEPFQFDAGLIEELAPAIENIVRQITLARVHAIPQWLAEERCGSRLARRENPVLGARLAVAHADEPFARMMGNLTNVTRAARTIPARRRG